MVDIFGNVSIIFFIIIIFFKKVHYINIISFFLSCMLNFDQIAHIQSWN